MTRTACPITALLLATLSSSLAYQYQDEAAFTNGLGAVRETINSGRYDAARAELLQLLEAHKGKGWVIARRAEIEEELRRCDFRLAHPEPDLRKLITGELLAWNERSGKIKLRYRGDLLNDFANDGNQTFHLHPLTFGGPYTLTFEGKRLPNTVPSAWLMMSGNVGYQVVFGHSDSDTFATAVIARHASNDEERLASKEMPPLRPGKPFKIVLEVRRDRIVYKYNNRSILQAKRSAGDAWGQIGFRPFAFDTLMIEGDAQASWFQGLVDKVEQDARAKFTKEWKPEAHLPAWMFSTQPAEPVAVKSLPNTWPRPIRKQDEWPIKVYEGFLAAGQYDRGLAYARGLKGFDEVNRALMEAEFCEHLDRWEEAIAASRLVLEKAPNHERSRLRIGRALVGLGRLAEAAPMFDALIGEHPDAADVYVEYASALLNDADVVAAKKLLARAAARPGVAPAVAGLHKMLLMAERGPAFGKSFEHVSRHYRVVSDINAKTCVEAAQVLEEALTVYKVRLDAPSLTRGDRMPVYLFSGQAGYLAYTQQILGEASAHTAGLYSPLLKQLLIWNLPDRAEMLRTVRHEGFHQFLDRVAKDPPVWFNEGMAEYYETMERAASGRLEGGQLRKDHVATLRGRNLVSLDKFLHLGHAEFYSGAVGLHYAQAWALVHFLRHGERGARAKTFETLLDAVRSEPSAAAVIEKALAGVDLKELELALYAYLGAL